MLTDQTQKPTCTAPPKGRAREGIIRKRDLTSNQRIALATVYMNDEGGGAYVADGRTARSLDARGLVRYDEKGQEGGASVKILAKGEEVIERVFPEIKEDRPESRPESSS